MKYRLTDRPGVVRDADGAFIPDDAANHDWQTYQEWLAAGNFPTPAPAPPSPVLSCALWQLQAVMPPAQWARFMAAVTATGDPVVSAFFAHGTNVITENSTTLLSIAEKIGLSGLQVTALVKQASPISIN